jgi:hypothetical protein
MKHPMQAIDELAEKGVLNCGSRDWGLGIDFWIGDFGLLNYCGSLIGLTDCR